MIVTAQQTKATGSRHTSGKTQRAHAANLNLHVMALAQQSCIANLHVL